MEGDIIAEIHIVPLGTGTTSLSRYVAACLAAAEQAQGITYQLTAMGTVVQGPLARVVDLVQKMHEAPFAMGVRRVLTTITIDDRRDKPATMESKVKAVQSATRQR